MPVCHSYTRMDDDDMDDYLGEGGSDVGSYLNNTATFYMSVQIPLANGTNASDVDTSALNAEIATTLTEAIESGNFSAAMCSGEDVSEDCEDVEVVDTTTIEVVTTITIPGTNSTPAPTAEPDLLTEITVDAGIVLDGVAPADINDDANMTLAVKNTIELIVTVFDEVPLDTVVASATRRRRLDDTGTAVDFEGVTTVIGTTDLEQVAGEVLNASKSELTTAAEDGTLLTTLQAEAVKISDDVGDAFADATLDLDATLAAIASAQVAASVTTPAPSPSPTLAPTSGGKAQLFYQACSENKYHFGARFQNLYCKMVAVDFDAYVEENELAGYGYVA